MAVSLLDLPAELRNQIYHYVVVDPERISIDLSNLDGPNTKQPALTKVCRQVRAEAITIYYLDNKFNLTIPATMVNAKYPSTTQPTSMSTSTRSTSPSMVTVAVAGPT